MNRTLSPITEYSRGDGLLMSSLASRTAAMMDAAITSVEAKRSCFASLVRSANNDRTF
jgi:hypothetical protein